MSNPLVFVAVAVVVVVLLIEVRHLPLRVQVAVAAFLAVPQVFLGPGASHSLPLSICWVFVMAPTALKAWGARGEYLHDLKLVLGALIGIGLLTLLRLGDVISGAVSILHLIALTVLLCCVLALARNGVRELKGAVMALEVWVAFEALLVVAFRVSPTAESRFLHSALASVFAGPDQIGRLFTTSPDNVLDAAKAGGFYLNANTASMFLGVSACLALGMWRLSGRTWHLSVALLAAVGVLFTGSKTGLVLALVVPGLSFVISSLWRKKNRRYLGTYFAAALVLLPFARSRISLDSPFAEATQSSLATREEIWRFAKQKFFESPILGQGYGGWQRSFSVYASQVGLVERLPPHNFILNAWSTTGIVGAALVIVFVLMTSKSFYDEIGMSRSRKQAQALSMAFGAFIWTWVHGFGDTSDFYGDTRVMFPLAIALGLLYALHQERIEGQDSITNTAPETSGLQITQGSIA